MSSFKLFLTFTFATCAALSTSPKETSEVAVLECLDEGGLADAGGAQQLELDAIQWLGLGNQLTDVHGAAFL